MHNNALTELSRSRYALLRSFRRDGRPVDTPIWFERDGDAMLFRTKVGPKTQRLAACRDVELTACDHRGRVDPASPVVAGHATVLSGAGAERANRMLRDRYGWQWTIVPLIKVPGVTNVTRDLSLAEKLRRAGDRGVWPGFVIVRVELP